MSLLSGLSEQTIDMEETDVLGGGSGPVDAGLYPMTIKMAYLSKSMRGALGLTIWGEIQLPHGGTREIKQTEYITSGDEKGNKKFYVKDGKSMPLPGYSWGNNLCLLGTPGISIETVDTGTKEVRVWNYDLNQEVLEEKEVLVGLINKTVIAGIQNRVENKTKLNQNSGKYEPQFNDDGSPQLKEYNYIHKVFSSSTRKTVAETMAQGAATFIDKWDEKYSGKVQDFLDKKAKPSTVTSNGSFTGTPAAAPEAATSLFTS